MGVAPELARRRRARIAVSAVFFINGVLFANLVPRLPEVKDRLDLSNGGFGSAIAAMPAGALLAGLFAPALIQRFGSKAVASSGLVGLALAVAAVPLCGGWFALAGTMLVIGALDAVIDVGQNAHGFRVQRAYGRSIVNAFHGLWSVGAVTGGLLGSVAAGLSVPLGAHLTTSGAVCCAFAMLARRFMLDGPEDAERASVADVAIPSLRRAGRRTWHVLAVLGVLAACGAFVEDAGASWAALYLRDEVGATAGTVGLGFVVLHIAMTTGRLTGDRVVDRFGQRLVTVVGGSAVAMGMGFALALPSMATTIVGFAAAGLGVATLVPAVMHAADELPNLRRGVGLTIVSWLLRVGFLVSPLLVGIVADAASLRAALLAVVLAGLVIVLLGRAVDVPTGSQVEPDRLTT